MDSPTVLTASVIEGEGDGKGETVFYSFTALKGDIKITVDGKTDKYSTPLRVFLMDEDGKELLPIYVVAKDSGAREVATKHFVREQKVIVKITTQDDAQVKLLTYKIKLDGAVKVETPPVATEATQAAGQGNATMVPEQPASAGSTSPTAPAQDQKLKDKLKTKAKDAAKSTLKKIIDN